MESVLNDTEKRFILAEMIKLSDVDVGVLIHLVKSHDIQPKWMYMQLPGGRNMSQCLHAAEAMFNTPMPPPLISPLKRPSLGELSDYGPNKRQALASPGEVSPRGFPPGPSSQPAPGTQPVNIQPRPNGFPPGLPAPSPSVSATPYNPAPKARKRGRPPKSTQSTWQVSTYQNITPAPHPPSPAFAPQPHSPHLPPPAAQQSPIQGQPDPKRAKKGLPEIAPRPPQGPPTAEPAAMLPGVPGAALEYQKWREETSRRDYYQLHTFEPPPRERPASFAPILPRPRSPLPPPRELPRGASTEPRHFAATPPPSAPEPVRNDSQTTTTGPIQT
ncbi:hypothetical protein F5144DRAFT_172118 [Chaetomium tenue]|uniref:Uncharacterized protein n=1 Tax=Chaetomium tenue TaxID=1854479 RepID=A0ACB7PEZ7_9PEZI|nr:hypothetical protein F5144DRAFT_172118 [Chaetomium globosum]